MIQSFLLIGQSNMAGRGILDSVPPIINESIKMLRNGRWQIMAEPIHNDRPMAGVGLASSFAASWQADHRGEQIGLIPCADGGTSLNDWQVGGALFDHAMFQAKLAQRSSQLTGILWHQGENDSSVELAAKYGEKFDIIINALRKQLGVPDVPLIIGAIGDFLPNGVFGAHFKDYHLVNSDLRKYAASHNNCNFVSAKGLTANEDQIHFNALSLRKLGLRYYQAFLNAADVTEALPDEDELLAKIYRRELSSNEKKFILDVSFASGKISLSEFQNQLKSIDK
ncbi:MAG: sialate O-acetylesterase [Sphingobacterium sp.]|uniref:sialate O-acetylesterase n=1 Tax=Sphingobacterium sp. TaxID=341027 RepID=UPI00283E2131|nr:sialate O-acetylesterase [Sphingobacterium sp.]MDR3007239.1 sialate O-acetylesterase [Sphingobacterium sp.]